MERFRADRNRIDDYGDATAAGPPPGAAYMPGGCARMAPISKTHPLHRWFEALVQDSFQQDLGLADARLLDYLADLLTEFIHVERINTVQDGSGRPIEEVAELLRKAETERAARDDERRRRFHRHIGDFTLFWTGVYPENLRHLRRRHSGDELIDYFAQGKRSYAIASELSSDRTVPAAQVFRALSEQFEYCVYGLGLVRKQWERADPHGFDKFVCLG